MTLAAFRPLIPLAFLLGLLVASAGAFSPVELNAKAVALMQNGEGERALPLLLEARQALPYEPVIKRNLAECYLLLGLQKLKDRNYEGAIDNFGEGKEYADRDARFWAFSGVAQRRLGDAGAAESEFSEALALSDEAPEILYQLGDLYYSQGEMSQAQEVLEQAAAARPENPLIAELLAKVRRESPVEEGMAVTRGGNFVISCDDELDPGLGDDILEILEDAYNDLGSEFEFYPRVQIPVLVYLRQQYVELTDAPGWTAALYDGKIRLPASGIEPGSPLLKSILYHEYSHVLVGYLARGRVPVWLNEGLAELAGRRLLTPPPARGEEMAFVPWRHLERSFERLDPRQVRSAYEQSYFMVNYLIEHFGRYKLNEFVVAAGREKDVAKAVDEVYGEFQVDYETLQQEWTAHFETP